jgi:hypothetical protein
MEEKKEGCDAGHEHQRSGGWVTPGQMPKLIALHVVVALGETPKLVHTLPKLVHTVLSISTVSGAVLRRTGTCVRVALGWVILVILTHPALEPSDRVHNPQYNPYAPDSRSHSCDRCKKTPKSGDPTANLFVRLLEAASGNEKNPSVPNNMYVHLSLSAVFNDFIL